MIDCAWAASLTRYECRRVQSLHGEPTLEIGTPFSLPGGAALVLYVIEEGDHVLISDNGDTLFHLAGLGIDISHGMRLHKLRDLVAPYGITLTKDGDLRSIAQRGQAPYSFARTISGFIALAAWAAEQMDEPAEEADLVAEAIPYIIARDPIAPLIRRQRVQGASLTQHTFDVLHAGDLIDVIGPAPQSTGSALRKVTDVLNGPFLNGWRPLIIVDDRRDAERAGHEIGILGAVTRALPFSRLIGNAALLH